MDFRSSNGMIGTQVQDNRPLIELINLFYTLMFSLGLGSLIAFVYGSGYWILLAFCCLIAFGLGRLSLNELNKNRAWSL